MREEIVNLLKEVDASMDSINDDNFIRLCNMIPLEVFGKILIDRPKKFPNLIQQLPKMPEQQVQIHWTGSSDHLLMTQSVNFIRIIVTAYNSLCNKSLSEANVLDYGCGWGRLIRLLYKYVPVSQIYGVDPWDRSIEICRECDVKGNLFLSDYLPRTLPTPEGVQFDFIMAFSVFTHLSEKATKICLSTLADYLANDGLLAFTTRPVDYWDFYRNINKDIKRRNIKELKRNHSEKGFAFNPHNREKIEGDITFGDTSMSLKYIENTFPNLEIVGFELSDIDPFQQVVFMKKKINLNTDNSSA